MSSWYAVPTALILCSCAAHASPLSESFWGEAYEGKRQFEDAEADFHRVAVAMPLATDSLANGLRVIRHQDHRVPVVVVALEYDVGSLDDPKGRGGLAHLTEHLLFRGSRNVQDGAFFRVLERAGATGINATTDAEVTRYTETVPSNQLELALWMESDRAAFPFERIDESKFEAEKAVVKNELLDNLNRPYGAVHEVIRRTLYPPGHPYREAPTLRETLADLDAISLDDVRKFFGEHYQPNAATMVLAGDFDDRSATALVTKYFGGIPAQPSSRAKRALPPSGLKQEAVLSIAAEVAAPVLVLTWPTPSAFAPDDAELDVLAAMLNLDGGLGWQLIHWHKIASHFFAHQVSGVLGSRFAIEVTLQPPGDFDGATRIIDAALDDLRANLPGATQTERSKAECEMALLFRNESLFGRTASFLTYRRDAGDPSFLSQDLARYTAVNQERVVRVAGSLQRNNRVIAKVVPTSGAPVAGILTTP